MAGGGGTIVVGRFECGTMSVGPSPVTNSGGSVREITGDGLLDGVAVTSGAVEERELGLSDPEVVVPQSDTRSWLLRLLPDVRGGVRCSDETLEDSADVEICG